MSQDFDDNAHNGFLPAKKNIGSVYPEHAYDAAPGVERVEALLTPSLLVKRFFFGFPLISPITKAELSLTELKDYIDRAIAQVEMDAKVYISPVVLRHRAPFDANLYYQHMWMEVPYKPIQKVLRMAICSASYSETDNANEQYPSGFEIFRIPAQWVDMSYATRGNIFVNPINPAFAAIGTPTAAAMSGANILQFIGQQRWVPAYWTIEVVCGFCSEDGRVPMYINEAIGMKAAMLLILNLLPLYSVVGHSIGLDGMSQSANDMMWNILKVKHDELATQYNIMINKIKAITANTMFTSNV